MPFISDVFVQHIKSQVNQRSFTPGTVSDAGGFIEFFLKGFRLCPVAAFSDFEGNQFLNTFQAKIDILKPARQPSGTQISQTRHEKSAKMVQIVICVWSRLFLLTSGAKVRFNLL